MREYESRMELPTRKELLASGLLQKWKQLRERTALGEGWPQRDS
jgi:hypothetical protein